LQLTQASTVKVRSCVNPVEKERAAAGDEVSICNANQEATVGVGHFVRVVDDGVNLPIHFVGANK
jgi:hypothetical protein